MIHPLQECFSYHSPASPSRADWIFSPPAPFMELQHHSKTGRALCEIPQNLRCPRAQGSSAKGTSSSWGSGWPHPAEKTSCVTPRQSQNRVPKFFLTPPAPTPPQFIFSLHFSGISRRVFSCVTFLEESCLMSSKSLLIPQVFVLIQLTPNTPGCTSQRTPWSTSIPSTARVVPKTNP